MTTAPGRYALDNADPGSPSMHQCLSGILDGPTVGLLRETLFDGDSRLPDTSRTLLLGVGNGASAIYVADMITDGRIVALDRDTRIIRDDVLAHPQVEVVTCDLLTEPLPAGPWDLIHARLLFAHLPNRRQVLADAAGQLAPGGVLAIEDWGVVNAGRVLDARTPRTGRLYQRYQQALIQTFAAAGNDPEWCVKTNAEMTSAGLLDVETVTRAESWRGGSPGCQLPIAVSLELGDRLVEHGITRDELQELRDDLADPATVVLGNLTWSTIGHARFGG